MLSIDRQAEQIRRRDALIRQLWMLALSLLSIIVLLGLIILGMTRTAAAANVCLTYKDARVLWPTRHIWWIRDKETGRHCWTNTRGKPPRGLKFDPVFSKAHAEDTQQKKPGASGRAVIKVVKPEDYNELDAAADRDLFFNAQPVPFWRFSALDDGFSTWHRRVEDLLK